MSALRRLSFLFVLTVAGLTSGACSRAHLTTSHGRAYHEAFTAQDATPGNAPSKSVHGLDSQEAAIIAGNYRKALSPKGDTAGVQNQLLMMAPQRPVGDSAGLPSSVPAGGGN